jgi:N-acetylglucosamine-6-phosphate deacetylase
VGNAVRFAGISLADALRLATVNPARVFGVDATYGTLAAGRSADLLLFRWDEGAARLMVEATIAAGQVAYRRAA